MYKGTNCERKSQLSQILTEPLSLHAVYIKVESKKSVEINADYTF